MRSRRRVSAGPDLEQRIDTIAVVDAMLRTASQRKFFTREEAAALLLDLQATVHDALVAPRVASAVNDAVISFRRERLLDAVRVADALLDIRLAATRAPRVDDLSEL
jgi:hypothetical protein